MIKSLLYLWPVEVKAKEMDCFKHNLFRRSFQFIFFLLLLLALFKIFGGGAFNLEEYSPLGGLLSFATYLLRGPIGYNMTMVQILMGVALAICVILFGKLFCSYICPLGFISELFFRIRGRLKLKALTIENGSLADKLFRGVKYLLLFALFYLALSGSGLFCNSFCPCYLIVADPLGMAGRWIVLISLVVLFLCSLFIDMFWCKYICPLGALSNILRFTLVFVLMILLYGALLFLGLEISWIWFLLALVVVGYLQEIILRDAKYNAALIYIYKDEERCDHCQACKARCPYGVNFKNIRTVIDVDCTLCGECVDACKSRALSITNSKKGKYLPVIFVLLLFLAALILGNMFEL